MANELTEIELELAWLVDKIPKDLYSHKSFEIRQGYLENSDPAVKDIRVREKGGNYTKTIKYPIQNPLETGYSKEVTTKLTKEEFERLWESTDNKIWKKRYIYPLPNNLTAEIDVYQNNLAGLIVAEVEFPSINAYKKFEKPLWFGKEVTDSKGIYPPVIANMGFPEVQKMNFEYHQKPHHFDY